MGKKGENRKKSILDAALLLVGDIGFESVTFQMIADRLRITQPNIFYYFPTKDALFFNLIETVLTSSRQASTPQNLNFNDSIRYLIVESLNWARASSDSAKVIVLLNSKACYDEKYSEIFARVTRNGARRVQDEIIKEFGSLSEEQERFSYILQKFSFSSLIYLSTTKGEAHINLRVEIEKQLEDLISFFPT